MNEQSAQAVRKTFRYKLKPTPEQHQALAFVACRCRELYNAALEERHDAWQKMRRERHWRKPKRPTTRSQRGAA
jgi:putative transposase